MIDERGEIRNAKNVAVIFSARGTVRSNHYHREGWHYLHVLGGWMRYRERPVGGGEETVKDIYPGGVVFTGPNVEHRTEFLEDTLMVSYAGKQGGDEYDADTVKIEW